MFFDVMAVITLIGVIAIPIYERQKQKEKERELMRLWTKWAVDAELEALKTLE